MTGLVSVKGYNFLINELKPFCHHFQRRRLKLVLLLCLRFVQIALSTRKAPEDYAPLDEGAEAHWEVVQRLLFLYAKLNPGQSYVQGMNEIIGPIYYAFACDPRPEWRGIQ